MTGYSNDHIASLVRPDRVHRDVYEDPDLFDLEMDRVFGRSWVYVGHESQVPEPGDFFCTRVGLQPVVMSRHSDGTVYVIVQPVRPPRRESRQRGMRECRAFHVHVSRLDIRY